MKRSIYQCDDEHFKWPIDIGNVTFHTDIDRFRIFSHYTNKLT